MPQLKTGMTIVVATTRFGPDRDGNVVRDCAAIVVKPDPDPRVHVFYDGRGGSLTQNLSLVHPGAFNAQGDPDTWRKSA